MDKGRTVKRSVVLVVEDEPLQRKSMEQILSAAGFTVLMAGRAETALAILDARDNIDAVVTDINMPGALDGFVVAWRARRQGRPVPVIVVSGVVQAGQEQPAMGFRFLPKPLDPTALVHEVRQAIRSNPHSAM